MTDDETHLSRLTADVAEIILDFRPRSRRALTVDWQVAHDLATLIVDHISDWEPHD